MKQLCPLTIANFFYKKFKEKDIFKLNHLTYFSYCWFKVLDAENRTLTFEKPYVTEHGIWFSVLLYEAYQLKDRTLKEEFTYRNYTPIDDDIEKLLDKVWDLYGKYESVYCGALTQKDKYLLVLGDYIPDRIIHKNYLLKSKNEK